MYRQTYITMRTFSYRFRLMCITERRNLQQCLSIDEEAQLDALAPLL